MKNWSTTTKWVVAIVVILILVAIYNRKQISDLFKKPLQQGQSLRSSDPAIQGFKNRASDISNRLTSFIDNTNAKLKAAGSDGMILPSSLKPSDSGLCKCWDIGIYAFWSKRCCNKALRITPNAKEDAVLNDFKSRISSFDSEIKSLSAETDSVIVPLGAPKEKCPCWCITYFSQNITLYCHKSSKCCDAAL